MGGVKLRAPGQWTTLHGFANQARAGQEFYRASQRFFEETVFRCSQVFEE